MITRLIETPEPNAADSSGRSHNLLGQRLGRKGRDTRERILAAVQRLLKGSSDISLSAVAREASVGMTTLYLYFSDLSELLLAGLEPLGGEIEAICERFDRYWSNDGLEAECSAFLRAHQAFWAKHSRLLHLRNSLADAGDQRMLECRRAMSRPVVGCLTRQMSDQSPCDNLESLNYVVTLTTMLERMATISTDETFAQALTTSQGGGREAFVEGTLRAEAHIIALTIRSRR